MRNSKLQTKILFILIVLFTTMLICISGGVGWWRYKQYQQEQEKLREQLEKTAGELLNLFASKEASPKLREENESLRVKIEKLEKELEELKKQPRVPGKPQPL